MILEAGEHHSGTEGAEGSLQKGVNDAAVRQAVVDSEDPASPKSLWSGLERSAWQLPEQLTVSEWADRYRYLDPMTSAVAGQWMTDWTPYLRGPMNAFTDPTVEKIVIVSATQVGKTESMLNCLGYVLDQDPAPAMWVAPRADDAEAMAKDRVQPMIRLSPVLSKHTTKLEDDLQKKFIKIDRMQAYFTGANSPAALSSKPIRYLFLDELDKYPPFSGREADPVKLATQRTSTFWNRKIVMCSTPTTKTGYIWREYQLTDRGVYFVPCPHCGAYQRLSFGQVRWPEAERDPKIVKSQRLAWYECAECKQKIEDRQKQAMIIAGVWAPESATIGKDGKVQGEISYSSARGFWINAIYSPWITFSDIAAEFLASRDNIEMLMNFINSWLAEVWEETTEDTTEDKIIRLEQDYPALEVPLKAICLTAGVDVQKNYMVYDIYAWGAYGECWLVRSGRAETWLEIEADICEQEYLASDGLALQVRLACIDTGFRTDEVYEFCRKWPDITRAIKGEDRISGVPWKVTRIDKLPTGAAIKGGLALWHLDTTFFKDKLTRMINAGPGDHAKFHVFKDLPDDYVKHMTAEHKIMLRDKRRRRAIEAWVKKSQALRNDHWDATVYAAAAGEMLRVAALRDEDLAELRREHDKPAQKDTEGERPWISRQRRWLR